MREFVELSFAELGRRIAWRGTGWTRRAWTPRRAGRWCALIRAISGRRRSICCSATRPRPASSSAGARRSAFAEMVRDMVASDHAAASGRRPMAGADYALAGKRVYVAGHRGMVGGAIVRRLASEGCLNADQHARGSRPAQPGPGGALVRDTPAAGRVPRRGQGRRIQANNIYRAEFIYDNLAIAMNVIHAAHRFGVEKLMFWAPPASIPSWRASRWTRPRCCRGRWSRPTSPMPSPRSRHQAGRELPQAIWLRLHQRHADQSLRPGRQLSPRTAMSCRPDPGASTRRRRQARKASPCGERARRAASSSTRMIWPMPVST